MKAVMRACALLLLCLSLVPAALADDAHSRKAKSKKNSKPAPARSSNLRAAARPVDPMPRGSASLFPTRPSASAFPALPKREKKEPFALRPMPATSATLGVFTVESAYVLPKRGWAISSYADKRSRMPGQITVLSLGWNVSVGLSDWFNVYFGWEPHRFIHVSNPSQLSLNTPVTNPPFPSPPAAPTIFRGLTTTPGSAPGYVEDYPFVNRNAGGVGEVVLGFKINALSEFRGDWFTLSIRNDLIIPTRRSLSALLDNQGQSGQFNWFGNISTSRTWWKDRIVSSGNLGYRITRDPRKNRVRLFHQADQLRFGTGTILFPKSRIQPMTETVATIYVGSTPTTTFGPRDPVESVWGVRFYPWSNVAIDAGYRRANYLDSHGDKNGFVIKLGTVYWPEKPKPVNRPPVASCSADKSSVFAESGEMVGVRAMASDPDNDTLSYSWSATGGAVDGTGAAVRWNSAGTRPGVYTITANVSDGKGGTASCAVDVRVDPKPNSPPTMSCSVDRSSVLVGERVRVTGVASDPDNDPLSYSWRTNGGQIIGSGSAVQLDTSGLSAGRYTVTGRVEDGRGGAADCSASLEVRQPPPPPQSAKINECFFRQASARVDNVCKRILDDVALRLQNDSKARVVLVGYADPAERRPDKLAKDRADSAKKYLESKGIAADRIDARAAGGQAGAGKQNRRLDVIWVPEGASY